MLIQVGGVISADSVQIEYEGVLQKNILTLDTSTGEADVYVFDSYKFKPEYEIEIKKVVFDVTKLHVYICKPIESVEEVLVK